MGYRSTTPTRMGRCANSPFGSLAVITYLILDDQQRVYLLIVTWAG
jgi:hypothetical protein